MGKGDQNLKAGIRFVKQQAADHGVDPARLGLTGASAGGHLATLAALTPEPGKPIAKEPAQRQDTQVKAIAVFFPPTDLVEWDTDKPADPTMVLPLLFLGGGAGHTEEEIATKKKATLCMRIAFAFWVELLRREVGRCCGSESRSPSRRRTAGLRSAARASVMRRPIRGVLPMCEFER